jgi:hypothetical protein
LLRTDTSASSLEMLHVGCIYSGILFASLHYCIYGILLGAKTPGFNYMKWLMGPRC